MIVVYILIGVLVFGILIASHEFGHFITAKACGVRVDEFSIGMGPAIWKKQKGETLYALRWIPIGGYCAMAGEDTASEDPRAFTNQAPWKRVIILCAGAFMNFVFGVLVIFFIFLSYDGFYIPVLAGFMEGCPYESAEGLQVGDRVWSIDGHRIYEVDEIGEYLSQGGDTYDIVLIRDGKKVVLDDFYMVRQVYDDSGKLYVVQRADYGAEDTTLEKMLEHARESMQSISGVGKAYFGLRPGYGVEEATFGKKLEHTWDTSMYFTRVIWKGLRDLIRGDVEVEQLAGPVGIVEYMAETGEQSESFEDALNRILLLAAMIAINLAIMNMLPIPALDGGRIFLLIVTVIIEAITRKKLNPKYEGYIHLVGMVLLLGLMAFVMFNDISRIVTK